MKDYVVVGGKRLKKGYTTGSCAAAAAKAATYMLMNQKQIESITIDTPAGVVLNLSLHDQLFSKHYGECAVVKDGGDDPDVTTGLKIYARVEWNEDEKIIVKGGEGIGTVTLPGLKVEIGKPAINPVPMEMIKKEVRSILPSQKGVTVTLGVPGGREVAQKTYNPKLGIVGGISIIGTKGIVEPMSEEAWKESLALELNMIKSLGYKTIVFVLGNYGEDFALKELKIRKDRMIKISNFVGYMLDRAVENDFQKILLVGHLGKLIKIGAGIFNTHSRVADGRMEILAAYAALEGAPYPIIHQIYQCKTTSGAAEIIGEKGLEKIYDRIVNNVSRRCTDFTFNKIQVGTVLFNETYEMLGIDQKAKEIIKELRNLDDQKN